MTDHPTTPRQRPDTGPSQAFYEVDHVWSNTHTPPDKARRAAALLIASQGCTRDAAEFVAGVLGLTGGGTVRRRIRKRRASISAEPMQLGETFDCHCCGGCCCS